MNPLDNHRSISFVYSHHLCAGCGICAALCPEGCIKIEINRSSGLIEPVVDTQRCVECGLCVQICPGWQLNIDSLRPKYECTETVPLLGSLSSTFIGCSCNDTMRIAAASGGVVSEILIYLLEQNLVDGAIVTRMSSRNPLETETFIARSHEEIVSAQKSKYCPVPACSILREVLDSQERYAFVGLPCHIAGIRKAQLNNKKLVAQLPYILGLFCSRTPNANATRHLLHTLGIDPKDVQSLDYRGGGHPGRLRILMKNGSVMLVDHLDERYWGYTFFKFFKPIRCWLCPDHSAELADISFADNWTNFAPFKGDVRGSSTIVARTPHSIELLQDMVNNQRIMLYPIPVQSVVDSQHLLSKSNNLPRLWIWRKMGHALPLFHETSRLQANTKEILATIPEFIRILLSMRSHHPMMMNVLICIFQVSEKVPILLKQILKRVRKVFKRAMHGLKAVSLERGCELNRSSKHKVVMIGGFGGHDIGDEAMPHADILNLKANVHDLEIVMCSQNPKYTREFHGERSIYDVTNLGCPRKASFGARFRVVVYTMLFLLGSIAQRFGIRMRLWPEARAILDEIASADLLFNVGGGNLNSIMPTELYKKCTTFLAAKNLKKPVILSGQTIGPFTTRVDALYARFCLNRVNMITFRDKNTSRERLQTIGVSKPVMLDASDDAMTIPSIPDKEAEELLRSQVSDSWWDMQASLIVVMNLKGSLMVYKGENRDPGLEREIDLMSKIADALVQTYEAKIIFLPTAYNSDVNDIGPHREIVSRMIFARNAVCVEKEYNDATLKGIINLAHVAIGARYHFAVFAASNMVPFLGMASGLYQQTKLKGLADLCKLPQCFVPEDMEFATFDQVWPKVQKFVDDRELIVNRLSQEIPILRHRSIAAVEAAIEILQHNSC